MIYQSRKRKYTSRKEKLENSNRFLKRALIFSVIVGILLLFFRWQLVLDWLKVFFY